MEVDNFGKSGNIKTDNRNGEETKDDKLGISIGDVVSTLSTGAYFFES